MPRSGAMLVAWSPNSALDRFVLSRPLHVGNGRASPPRRSARALDGK